MQKELPVAIIGGGPVGLAAAAHLAERGVDFRLYEAGASVGANVRDWAHVRIFTTWEQSIDGAAQRLLERAGWRLPAPNHLPTGGEIDAQYLQPLAALPEIGPNIRTHSRVVAISRRHMDKVASQGRGERPFTLRIETAGGETRIEQARAVIDASGTWQNPNPLGADGLPAPGEASARSRIAYGMPDVLGARRADYAGLKVAVVGGGYSAINTLLDLVQLRRDSGAGEITWVVRGRNKARIYGGGSADQLAARGALGTQLRALVEGGAIRLVTGFAIEAIEQGEAGLTLVSPEGRVGPVDAVVAATGQRPDLAMTRELRLSLDPWLESVEALGPLIDPNLHSCGSVPPHGHRETAHPEPGFYTIGIKSYGRAPTFLLLTGYEQARSVAAAIAGDMAAADAVQLVLPETGICSTDVVDDAGCCGGPAPEPEAGCCVADLVAKERGAAGCGCAA